MMGEFIKVPYDSYTHTSNGFHCGFMVEQVKNKHGEYKLATVMQVTFGIEELTQCGLVTFILFAYEGDDDSGLLRRHAKGTGFAEHVLSICRDPCVIVLCHRPFRELELPGCLYRSIQVPRKLEFSEWPIVTTRAILT